MRKFLVLLSLLIAAPAFAQTASPNLNDQQILSGDPTFQNRVRESLLSFCSTVSGETITGLTGTMPLALHLKRANLCQAVTLVPDSYKTLFADFAAANATVIGDATQAGTVPLTSTNVAAQATKVLDTDLNNAVASVLNVFLTVP